MPSDIVRPEFHRISREPAGPALAPDVIRDDARGRIGRHDRPRGVAGAIAPCHAVLLAPRKIVHAGDTGPGREDPVIGPRDCMGATMVPYPASAA